MFFGMREYLRLLEAGKATYAGVKSKNTPVMQKW